MFQKHGGQQLLVLAFPSLSTIQKVNTLPRHICEPSLFLYQQLRKGISLILILQGIQQNFPLKLSEFDTLNDITLVVSGLENRYLYVAKAPEAMHFNTTNRLVCLVCIELKASLYFFLIFLNPQDNLHSFLKMYHMLTSCLIYCAQQQFLK